MHLHTVYLAYSEFLPTPWLRPERACFSQVHNASAALWPMRGHQVSTAHHPSSLRTWPEFRAFVSDLAVFGTNQIEVAHLVHLGDAAKDCTLPEAALVHFRAANSRGPNF
jgi:hypothetical protein